MSVLSGELGILAQRAADLLDEATGAG